VLASTFPVCAARLVRILDPHLWELQIQMLPVLRARCPESALRLGRMASDSEPCEDTGASQTPINVWSLICNGQADGITLKGRQLPALPEPYSFSRTIEARVKLK